MEVCCIARILHDFGNRHPFAIYGKHSVDETPRVVEHVHSSFPLCTKDMSARV